MPLNGGGRRWLPAGDKKKRTLTHIWGRPRGDQLPLSQRSESPRAAPARDDAEARAWVCEDRARRGDACAAGEREVESAAHAVAVDGGDCLGSRVGDELKEPLAARGELARRAGRERAQLAYV